jgi:hypothetical protein
MDEQKQITVEPGRLELGGLPGAELATAVRITNSGDVALRLELPSTITLHKSDALATSIRRAFKGGRGDVAARLIALGEDLRASSVEVAVQVAGKLSAIKPGETRGIKLKVHVPELDRSVAWVGSLALGGEHAPTVVVSIDRASA